MEEIKTAVNTVNEIKTEVNVVSETTKEKKPRVKRQPAAQLLVGSLYKNGKKLVLVERNLEGRYITIGLRMSTKTGKISIGKSSKPLSPATTRKLVHVASYQDNGQIYDRAAALEKYSKNREVILLFAERLTSESSKLKLRLLASKGPIVSKKTLVSGQCVRDERGYPYQVITTKVARNGKVTVFAKDRSGLMRKFSLKDNLYEAILNDEAYMVMGIPKPKTVDLFCLYQAKVIKELNAVNAALGTRGDVKKYEITKIMDTDPNVKSEAVTKKVGSIAREFRVYFMESYKGIVNTARKGRVTPEIAIELKKDWSL